ncbi:MAG: hypothetical protein COA43_00160 [Robiginitomaculum sp.]|nr:MAG: hypothetical protein COA43_00160 [Robiginitomaculum sp.]
MANLYLIIRRDAPDSLAKRLEVMQAHLKYAEDNKDRFMIGGALRFQPEQPAVGSAMVINASDLEAAGSFANADPFVANGVYESTEIFLFNVGVGAWIADKKL